MIRRERTLILHPPADENVDTPINVPDKLQPAMPFAFVDESVHFMLMVVKHKCILQRDAAMMQVSPLAKHSAGIVRAGPEHGVNFHSLLV